MLELSEKYEKMPEFFKLRVPKTHYKLENMISLYDSGLRKEHNKTTPKGALIEVLIFDGKNSLEGKCGICFRNLFSSMNLRNHIGRFHNSPE